MQNHINFNLWGKDFLRLSIKERAYSFIWFMKQERFYWQKFVILMLW